MTTPDAHRAAVLGAGYGVLGGLVAGLVQVVAAVGIVVVLLTAAIRPAARR